MSNLHVYTSSDKAANIIATRDGIVTATRVDNHGKWVHPEPPIYVPPPPPRRSNPANPIVPEEFYFILHSDIRLENELSKKIYTYDETDFSYFVIPAEPDRLIYQEHWNAIRNQEYDTGAIEFFYDNGYVHMVSDGYPSKFMPYSDQNGLFTPSNNEIPPFFYEKPEATYRDMLPYDHILENGEPKYIVFNSVLDRSKERYGYGLYAQSGSTNRWRGMHDDIEFLQQFIVCEFFLLNSFFENLGGGNLVWTGDYNTLGETPDSYVRGMAYYYPSMNSHPGNNYGGSEITPNKSRNNFTVNVGGSNYADGVPYAGEGILRPGMTKHLTSNPFEGILTTREGSWSLRWNFYSEVGFYPFYQPGDVLPTYDTNSRVRNFPDYPPDVNYTKVSNHLASIKYDYTVERNPPPLFYLSKDSLVFEDEDEVKTVELVSHRATGATVNLEQAFTTAISNYTPNPVYSPPTDEFFNVNPSGIINLVEGIPVTVEVSLNKANIKDIPSNYYTSFYNITAGNDLDSLNLALHWSPPESRSSLDLVKFRVVDKTDSEDVVVNNFIPVMVTNTDYELDFAISRFPTTGSVNVNLECVNFSSNLNLSPASFVLDSPEDIATVVANFGYNDREMIEPLVAVVRADVTSPDEGFNQTVYFNIKAHPMDPFIIDEVESSSRLFGMLHFETSDKASFTINSFVRAIPDGTTVTLDFVLPNGELIPNPPSISYNSNNWNDPQTVEFELNPDLDRELYQVANIVMSSNDPVFSGELGKVFLSTRYSFTPDRNLPVIIQDA